MNPGPCRDVFICEEKNREVITMKKTILLLCALALLLVGCGKKDPTVDYGSSERYTREDMDAAIGLIRAEFDTWKGCELHALRGAGLYRVHRVPQRLPLPQKLRPGGGLQHGL